MTSLRESIGRPVISRSTAEDLGRVAHVVIDAATHAMPALVIGSGKKAQVVDWPALTGFGPDAVMVNDEAAIRSPTGPIEEATVAGRRELLGARALTEGGVALGQITDVDIDGATGQLLEVRIGDRTVPADHLLGLGSYAAVLSVDGDGGSAGSPATDGVQTAEKATKPRKTTKAKSATTKGKAAGTAKKSGRASKKPDA